MKRARLLIQVLFILLITLCLGFASCGLFPSAQPIREKLALADIADRLGIEPSLPALMEYITSTLETGMSYEEVHNKLGEIAPFRVEYCRATASGYKEIVTYSFGWGILLRINLDYDSSMRLQYIERVFSYRECLLPCTV